MLILRTIFAILFIRIKSSYIIIINESKTLPLRLPAKNGRLLNQNVLCHGRLEGIGFEFAGVARRGD